MSGLEIGTAEDDSELEALARVDAESFVSSIEHSRRWLAALRPHAVVRLARRGGAELGAYALAPVGQGFGGCRVPAMAVVGVAVRPEARGAGVGGALMRDLVGMARESGAAVAPLWAAVPRFYRRWGWGVGDRATTHHVRVDGLLPLRGRGEPVRDPAAGAWLPVWSEHVAPYDAALEPVAWILDANAAEERPGEHHHSLGWRESGRLTGYVRFAVRRSGSRGAVVTSVSRFAALTGDALRGLLHLLGSSDGQGDEVVFRHGRLPARSPLLHVLPDPHRRSLRSRASLCWMQRLVGVRGALRARGWEPGIAGRVSLAVDDPVSVETARLRLEVEAGHVEVREGGSGELRLGVDVLASWYCGSLDLVAARRLGLADGPPEAAALLDGIRPRREVWLAEEF